MKLSVIIPAYNLERHISRPIDSLINQTAKDFEIIIVDDGSEDNTYNIANEILLNSEISNYKIIKKKNEGVSSARNIGLKEAVGRYVLFLDGDDYISHDLVESLLSVTENGEPDIICWGYNTVNENKTTLINFFDIVEPKMREMSGTECLKDVIIHKSMFIWTGSIAYKKEVLIENALQFTIGCSNGEDQEFCYKALSRVKKVLFINKILSYYVQREGSISNSYNLKRFDAINAMNRTYDYIVKSPIGNVKEVGEIIKSKKIIGNYLFNLESCFLHSSNKDINFLLREIDNKYPYLNNEIKVIIREYKGNDKKFILKIRLFLFSPVLYFKLISFKRKIILYLKN